MAKIILKCRYLKPGSSAHSQNLIKYIAKRDGVDKIDDTWMCLPVSSGQKKLIREILHDFPDAKSSYEYQDYISSPNRGNASEFISRAIEENIDLIAKREKNREIHLRHSGILEIAKPFTPPNICAFFPFRV